MLQLAAMLAILVAASGGGFAQGLPEAPTLGVRYFRITAATDSEYRGDAKALASSHRAHAP